MKIHFIWAAWERLYRLNYNIPPLGILRIAGLTPDHVEVRFTDEMVEPVDLQSNADIVAISFLTPSAHRAYALADHFRSRGQYVVFGGTHTTIVPEEARTRADTIFIGEADREWPCFLEDYVSGNPSAVYRNTGYPTLSGQSPVPRHLLKKRVYPYENPVLIGIESMELSRGCSSHCAYCLVPFTQGSEFRNRPLNQVDEEFASIARTDGIIFFTDNNLLGNWPYTRQALERLIPYEKDWFGLMAPEDAAADPAVLDLLVRSGLCGIYGTVKAVTGRETPEQIRERIRRLRRLEELGVVVIATFALGWDDHPPDVFSRTLDFCLEARLTVPEFIINTPFPGSRLFNRYAEEGRLLSRDWSKYNGNHAVFRPAQMSPADLEAGYHWCYDEFYRHVDRDKALFDGFRDRVLKAMIRSRKKQKLNRDE